MSQIKISVPHYDHVALRAMAKALEEIAAARAEEDSVEERMNHIHISHDESFLKQVVTESLDKAERGEAVYYSSEEAAAKMDAFKEEIREKYDPAVSQAPTTDSTGTPWDERIHSASKVLNSDGTWRVRRKPADKTPEEWADYIKWVEEDIHLVESLRPEDDEDPAKVLEDIKRVYNEAFPPPVTPAGDDFHVDAGVVTEQEVAAIPAPPPPPVVAPAAPVYSVDDSSYTFPQVMQFLTERHGRITSPDVDQIIADMGLSSIMDLNTQPEHTGPFIARVKAHLGE